MRYSDDKSYQFMQANNITLHLLGYYFTHTSLSNYGHTKSVKIGGVTIRGELDIIKPQVTSPVSLTFPPSPDPLVSYSGPPADWPFLLVCPPEAVYHNSTFSALCQVELAIVARNV